MFRTLALLILTCQIVFAQLTPLEKNNYQKLTSYEELQEFITEIDRSFDFVTSEILTSTVEGRNIYVVYFSKGEFGRDKNKLKVLFFAQQHGNEQSGKEGALLLIKEMTKPENQKILDRIDLAVIPQMNPDGSEKNQRRNSNGVDLNRNHLILTENETIALHKLFDKYNFEVTMDVHEYWPYGQEWKKLGFRKNYDVTIGAITNINISQKIKKLSYEKYLPFAFDYITQNGYTAFHYLPGGPIGVDYLRYSTFDINDGRQSFGILNTLSFIQEGMNGENYTTDNIERRTKSQMTGMLALLKFGYKNYKQIKKIVNEERRKLIENKASKTVAIQLDHFSDGTELKLKLLSYYSNKDTLITVKDFRPVVKSLYDVERPKGYLIPKQLTDIKDWMDRHNLRYFDASLLIAKRVEQYVIDSVGKIDFERDTIKNPFVSVIDVADKITFQDYYFLPVNQLKNNLIVIALEPKSMLGLVTYKQFEYLINAYEKYPILRVRE